MDKVQKALKAKSYLEYMINSIDPTTKETIDDTVLQKQEVKNVFEYLINLLDEFIANEGEIININTPLEFSIDKINKNLIPVSSQPIQIGGFVKRINNQVNNSQMETFKQSLLMKWLIDKGYLSMDKQPVLTNKTIYCTTETSGTVGIVEQNKIDSETGEIKKSVVLTEQAQKFIINNLENIIGSTDEIKLPEGSVDNYETICMAGQKWTDDEQERLIIEFTQEKLEIVEIAIKHHRKVGGIISRLKKLGLIEQQYYISYQS